MYNNALHKCMHSTTPVTIAITTYINVSALWIRKQNSKGKYFVIDQHLRDNAAHHCPR